MQPSLKRIENTMSLRIEQDGRVRRIKMADPGKRNLLDASACRHLLQELRHAAADDDTGAILLEAEGQVFCMGAEPGDAEELFAIGRSIMKPIVAAVQGVAVAGGVAIAANAHVVIAAQGTSFGLTDIREGRWNEAIYRAVATAIGERRALELSLTGRIFTAPEALSWGLVHMVAPAFELEDRAFATANALANANPDAVRHAMERR
jgi:enoyl-CoA hydratase/carnithine racemase